MRKTAITLLAMILAAPSAFADGRWTYYAAYHNALQNIPVGDAVFSLCDGSIFSYSPGDSEVRTYDKTNGLSDVNIKLMAYCKEEACLILVYSNSNIDLFYPESGETLNIPQYMNSSLADKTINDLSVSGSFAYLATNMGVSVLDIARGEFRDTYRLDKAASSCAYAAGKIYASTSSGLIAGDTGDNLLDASKWKSANPKTFRKLRSLGGGIYGAAEALFKIDPATGEASLAASGQPAYLNADDGATLICGNENTVNIIDQSGGLTTIRQSNPFKYLSLASGTYWASCGYEGLRPYRADSAGNLKPAGEAVSINSPIRNYCAHMTMTPANRLLVAGGLFNYNRLYYEGTLYSRENGHFTNFEDSVSQYTSMPYRNLTGIAEDPKDPAHHFATSSETGLYEFRDGKYVAHYDHSNSGLTSGLPGDARPYMYVCLTAPVFDSEGNLWMFNNETDTVIKVRMKDGSWQRIYIDAVKKYPTFDHLMFDRAGRAWFTHRRTTASHHAGVGCLDYNGTIADGGDDKSYFRYNFVNQDGTSYNPNTVDAIAIDNDGSIWVGTIEGPFVITNPDGFMDGGFTFTQMKVPRNDGSGYADYLLTGVPVTAIAVDAANRKWIGTSGSGLYLIGADNVETISHFTAGDSPLVSDNILSLAIDGKTGEVMIGTDAGLMGYRSEAAAVSGKISDDDLKIYPNPVRPDFYGDVTIGGLPDGAEVKIATTGGQVVVSGKAANGEFKWDVRDAGGNDVGAGVYFVLVSAAGGGSARGRIAVIR